MLHLNQCRKHDQAKLETEIAFFPIYTIMFLIGTILNSLLLYVVIKKEHFVHEKRSFHKLFQVLIGLDLTISILLLPQIIIKAFTEDSAVLVSIDAFLMVRDFSISSQMIVLVLIAIDRLLAFVAPLSNYWRLDNVMIVLNSCITILAILYCTRFILLTIPSIPCHIKENIDKYAKNSIGGSGGLFMILILVIYSVLFLLLCHRQILKQRQSILSLKFMKANQIQNDEESSVSIQTFRRSSKDRSSKNLTKLTLKRRIGSIKFAKVLFSVNLLMIISYLPAVLYNANIIKFPSFSVYYLFYFHAFGDPILFFLTRPELKKGLISIFCKKNNKL